MCLQRNFIEYKLIKPIKGIEHLKRLKNGDKYKITK